MPPRRLILFFCAAAAMAVGLGVHESVFNNFLADAYSLDAAARGALEFPRELPGLLVVLMSGLLCMLPVTRVGAVGALGLAAGMVGLSWWGGRGYYVMIALMVLGSAGMHLMQPVGATIVLALSKPEKRGTRLGQLGAVTTVGTVLGTGIIWVLFDFVPKAYAAAFLVAGAMAVLSALAYGLLHIPEVHQPRARLVVHRKFRLYYVLELLFGARKQIFITFGPWVLIQVYGYEAEDIAKLLFAGALIGIVFKPLAGRVIDQLGERFVLMADGLMLAVVCLGYGYAAHLSTSLDTAHAIAGVCFVLDQLLFALGSGRAVYVSRLAVDSQEVNATLALGISVNHVSSMLIPMVAGLLWARFGYEQVFAAAAVLALIIAAVASGVPRPGGTAPVPVPRQATG